MHVRRLPIVKHHKLHPLLFAFLAVAAIVGPAFADETARAKGYLTPPKGGFKVRRGDNSKARARLGAKCQVLPDSWDLREKGGRKGLSPHLWQEGSVPVWHEGSVSVRYASKRLTISTSSGARIDA